MLPNLERIATALYVTLEAQKTERDEISQVDLYITKIKPHISVEQARIALEQEAGIRNKAKILVQSREK